MRQIFNRRIIAFSVYIWQYFYTPRLRKNSFKDHWTGTARSYRAHPTTRMDSLVNPPRCSSAASSRSGFLTKRPTKRLPLGRQKLSAASQQNDARQCGKRSAALAWWFAHAPKIQNARRLRPIRRWCPTHHDVKTRHPDLDFPRSDQIILLPR